jgi:photosystem II stability/assembly factor-like uncharacterized protein
VNHAILPFTGCKLARLVCLMAVLVLTYLSPVQAKIKWTISGPEGGQVKCLASPDATGTIVYAGCNGGVFKSTDAGEHWQPLPGSPPNVVRLAVNPANPNVVYAGWDNGVSRSTDGGRTWQLCFNSAYGAGMGGRPTTSLAIDPHDPQRVYATFGSTISTGGFTHGPFTYSTDGGTTWTETVPEGHIVWGDTPTKIYSIPSLAIDPFQSNIIYVPYINNYRSQDYGKTFFQMPKASGNDQIYAQPDAQGVYYSYGSSLYRSNTWGDAWFPTYAPSGCKSVISHQGIGLAVLSANSSGVSKGYYSPFTPDVWTAFNEGLGNAKSSIQTLLLHAPYGAFAATGEGVYRTDTINLSGDWRPKNLGLVNATITCLASDPLHIIYAGTIGKGIFKSIDHGVTWQAINNGITVPEGSTLTVNAISVDPHNYFLVYAATNMGLYRSTDRGATWLSTRFTSNATSVLADPVLPATVFAIAEDSSDSGTWFSNNGGATWSFLGIPAGGNWNALVCGATDFPLYAVGGGYIHKLDSAITPWQLLTPLPPGVFPISMAVDPRSPNILYVGTYQDGLYKSINGGANWTRMDTVGPPFNFGPQRLVNAVTVDPVNSDVYVGLQNGTWTTDYIDPKNPETMNSGGVWKSSDGGTTWRDCQLPPYRGVNAILLDKFARETIYCGLQNSGIARGTKRGYVPMQLLLGN